MSAAEPPQRLRGALRTSAQTSAHFGPAVGSEHCLELRHRPLLAMPVLSETPALPEPPGSGIPGTWTARTSAGGPSEPEWGSAPQAPSCPGQRWPWSPQVGRGVKAAEAVEPSASPPSLRLELLCLAMAGQTRRSWSLPWSAAARAASLAASAQSSPHEGTAPPSSSDGRSRRWPPGSLRGPGRPRGADVGAAHSGRRPPGLFSGARSPPACC
mmetsp:Transcript_28479/g.67673  ORF Transcript_28479/g.67673 Transcript_28479/m.67673 type:complete len:213 (-) Transcript_28479:786-1424(-)